VASRETGLLKASLGYKLKVYVRSNRFGSTATGFKSAGTVVSVIGSRVEFKSAKRSKLTGKNAERKPAFYSHLVEKGTAPHSMATRVDMKAIRRGATPFNSAGDKSAARRAAVKYFHSRDKAKGKKVHPGAKPKPFLGPAFESQKSTAMNIIREEIRKGIASA
jgi:HK97 gp10 family phage protein